jgi:hypothetical protein
MNLYELRAALILEGGQIFKNPDGSAATQRINLADIPHTLNWLNQITGLPTTDNALGSVGKKASSGDLDIVVDQNKISKDELVAKLSAWARSQGEDPHNWVRKSGISVHFLTPIGGDAKRGFVQTDFMFHDNIPWMKFSMYSAGDASRYSGADRNMLMSSIAKARGLKYSWQKGLIRREDESLISRDPNKIAAMLLGAKYRADVFLSVEAMLTAIHNDSKLMALIMRLVNNLAQTENPDGSARKPGEIRANREELDRLRRLLDLH